MIWYDMIWYDMIWYDMIWYDMIWCDVMWCDVMWCDIWYDMIWYDMIWYDMIYDKITLLKLCTWNGLWKTWLVSNSILKVLYYIYNFTDRKSLGTVLVILSVRASRTWGGAGGANRHSHHRGTSMEVLPGCHHGNWVLWVSCLRLYLLILPSFHLCIL